MNVNANRFVFSGHIAALDGVRGLAILAVMVIHFFPSNYDGSPLLATIGRLVDSGWVGVDLFFVLSGFLITGILLDTAGTPGYFRNFYAKRTLRIFPLYYGVLFCLLALTPLLRFEWQGKAIYFLLYLQNFLSWEGGKVLYIAPYIELGHFWSLAIEEQFYLVWPGLVFLCRTPARVAILAAVIIVSVLAVRGVAVWRGTDLSVIYHGTLFRVDSLAFGALLASSLKFVSYSRLIKLARGGFLLGLGVVIVLLVEIKSDWKGNPLFAFAGYSCLGLWFASMIALSLQPGSLMNRAFSLGALRFMGKYSYGLYVWHLLFFPYFAVRLHPYLNAHLGSKVLGGVLTGATAAALAFALAIPSYHLYEKPFLRLKKYFSPPGEAGRPNEIISTRTTEDAGSAG